MKIGAIGKALRKAARRDMPKVIRSSEVTWAKENKLKPSPADEKDSRHLEEAASPGPRGREPKSENACALRKNDDNVDMDSHKNADDNTSMEDTSAMAKESQ